MSLVIKPFLAKRFAKAVKAKRQGGFAGKGRPIPRARTKLRRTLRRDKRPGVRRGCPTDEFWLSGGFCISGEAWLSGESWL